MCQVLNCVSGVGRGPRSTWNTGSDSMSPSRSSSTHVPPGVGISVLFGTLGPTNKSDVCGQYTDDTRSGPVCHHGRERIFYTLQSPQRLNTYLSECILTVPHILPY